MRTVTAGAATGSGTAGLPLWAVCALSFAGLFGTASLLLLGPGARSRRDARRARLAELQRYRLVGAYEGDVAVAAVAPEQSEIATRVLAVLDRAMRARGSRAGLADELERAGLRMRPEEWAAVRIAGVVGFAALGAFLVGSVLAVPVGAAFGWVVSRLVLRVAIRRRAAAFEANLPDALQLLAGALRSGFALNQSIGAVVREGIEPVAGEFGRAMQEVRLGAELTDALDGLAERMASYDMALVVMAIRTAREVGGNLAETLQNTVATMRERVQLRSQVRVLSAEGRLSAKVLVALPILMTIYLAVFKPGYLHPLYTTGVGMALIAVGVTLLGAGSFWLSRLTKIEV